MNYTTVEVRVRYAETDQMSFVHHSNYLKYFELARLEWLNFLDISYSQLEESGVLMPVVRASAEYIKPLFFDESFKVTVSLIDPPKATLKFQYVVVNSKNIIVCKGETVLAFLSKKTMRPTRCPKILNEKFS
tara:strand:- start:25599 stop:25994 length:396 start_codon:yes stop_codon:yes gene_type:complete